MNYQFDILGQQDINCIVLNGLEVLKKKRKWALILFTTFHKENHTLRFSSLATQPPQPELGGYGRVRVQVIRLGYSDCGRIGYSGVVDIVMLTA